jgi:hypothetical protein
MRAALVAPVIAAGGLLIACDRRDHAITPVTVPVGGNILAVQDRWKSQCPTPEPPYGQAWDSTLADTAVILAAPLNADTIASLFQVTREADGLLWYDSEGRGGDPMTGTDSVRVGPWQVVMGQYESMSYPDDIEIPMDEQGRGSPEHWRQGWFYGFAPTSESCAVVVAWRSPPLGSYRGPRYGRFETVRESVQVVFERIRGPT